MWEAVFGKLLSLIPWSWVRLGHEESAYLCTDGHPIAWFVGGDDAPWPRGPLHIDMELKLWSRTEHRTTVRGLEAVAAR